MDIQETSIYLINEKEETTSQWPLPPHIPYDYYPTGFIKKGFIILKGPTITKGYYHRDAANKEAFTEDGYFRTGDANIVRIFEPQTLRPGGVSIRNHVK